MEQMSLSGKKFPDILWGVESLAPTPQALYARLRALHPDASEEVLALRILGLKSTKTLRQLNEGEGVGWENAIRLLHQAGWLCLGRDANCRARLHQLTEQLRRLTLEVEAAELPAAPTPAQDD